MNKILRPLRLRSVYLQRFGINAHARAAPFTQYARLHESAVTSKPAVQNSSNGTEKEKPGGSYARVLAVFALGIPIGWLVSQYSDNVKNETGTARPTDFVEYTVTGKEDISSTCSIFTLKPATRTSLDATQLYDARAITSVQFKQPQLQIARSYTTLPPVEAQDPDELRFLIRREQRGEVSGYLHRLSLGAEVEVRGPSVEYLLPEDVKQVVFLAGGTGIAPALQVANKLSGKTDVHVLWASRRREDCEGGESDTKLKSAASSWNFFGWFSPFGLPSPDAGKVTTSANKQHNAVVKQMCDIKQETTRYGLVKVDCFVDEEGTFIRPDDVSTLVNASRNSTAETTQRLLLVSGPEGFINYWAGPKQWSGGREVQGPLGGVLSSLDLSAWTVVKL